MSKPSHLSIPSLPSHRPKKTNSDPILPEIPNSRPNIDKPHINSQKEAQKSLSSTIDELSNELEDNSLPKMPKVPSHHPNVKSKKAKANQLSKPKVEAKNKANISDKHTSNDGSQNNQITHSTSNNISLKEDNQVTENPLENTESGYDDLLDAYVEPSKAESEKDKCKEEASDSNNDAEEKALQNPQETDKPQESKESQIHENSTESKVSSDLGKSKKSSQESSKNEKPQESIQNSDTEKHEEPLHKQALASEISALPSSVKPSEPVLPLPKAKKTPPVVPKKPSSRIAQFQKMLREQQQHDMEFVHGSNKSDSPRAFIPRPSSIGGNGQFAKNLNMMLGRRSSTQSDQSIDSSKSRSNSAELKMDELPKVPAARPRQRGRRARGPRGRSLPKNVKDKVTVDDNSLQTRKLSTFIGATWSIDFSNPHKKLAKKEEKEHPEQEISNTEKKFENENDNGCTSINEGGISNGVSTNEKVNEEAQKERKPDNAYSGEQKEDKKELDEEHPDIKIEKENTAKKEAVSDSVSITKGPSETDSIEEQINNEIGPTVNDSEDTKEEENTSAKSTDINPE